MRIGGIKLLSLPDPLSSSALPTEEQNLDLMVLIALSTARTLGVRGLQTAGPFPAVRPVRSGRSFPLASTSPRDRPGPKDAACRFS